METDRYHRYLEEIRHLQERMDRARGRAEYEYYRNRLRDLEYREMRYMPEPIRYPPPTPKLVMDPAAPAKPDPLSFLTGANKNLLLT